MKKLLLILTLVSMPFVISCDPQSGITKKSLEKFGPTPTPSVEPTPVEEPIDPADVVQADTAQDGKALVVNLPSDRKTLNCDKYNPVMVNSRDEKISLKGACRQLTVNGNGNEITADGIAEVVFNGEDNKVTYTKYVNGKRPSVRDNKGSNTVEKAATAVKK